MFVGAELGLTVGETEDGEADGTPVGTHDGKLEGFAVGL
jgi:hypothetical protein